MSQYIIAIDQSTSSTKALLFDETCRVVARTNVDHKQYYPQTGWVEHDAEEIYYNMVEAIKRLKGKVNSEEFPTGVPSAAGMAAANYSLFTLHSSLFTFHFSLFTFQSSLFTLHFSLFTFHFSVVSYSTERVGV